MFFLYVCMHIECIPVTLGGQEKVLDALELEFQAFVSPHKRAKPQTWVFQQSKCF